MDLRQGSIVVFRGHFLKIESAWIDENGIQLFAFYGKDSNFFFHTFTVAECSPYEITENLLSKLEFKKLLDSWWMKDLDERTKLTLNINTGETMISSEGQHITIGGKTTLLHQLQNLWRSLTGNEIPKTENVIWNTQKEPTSTQS